MLPSAIDAIVLTSPHAWKTGQATSTRRRERYGILLRKPPGRARRRPSSRAAPLGVPVVPLVSSTSLGLVDGLGGSLVAADAISASRVTSPAWVSASDHASTRPNSGSMLATTSANSAS